MMTIHRRGSPLRAFAATFAAAGLMVLGAGQPPAMSATAPAPPAAAQERAIAVVKPSVVLVGVKWRGAVQPSEAIGWLGSYEATTSCSGAIMSNDGYVVTAGHCTDPAEGRRLVLDVVIARLARSGSWTRAQTAVVRAAAYATWKVEGSDGGSEVERVVGVYPTAAASGITVTTAMQAVVKQTVPFGQGDVALLKVEPQNGPLPALAPAAQDPTEGSGVIASGYPASVGEVVDPGGGASYKPGSTSSLQTVNGAPFTEINAETSAGMSGGPVSDYQGNVLGTVSFKPGTESQPFNFMTRTSTVRQLLANNGVPTTLGAADKAFRAGLDDYFAGRYHAAVKQFDRVLATMPSHQQAQLYKGRAQSKYGLENTGPGAALYVGIGGAVVLLAGGAGAVLLLRRRHGGSAGRVAAAPAPPAGALPGVPMMTGPAGSQGTAPARTASSSPGAPFYAAPATEPAPAPAAPSLGTGGAPAGYAAQPPPPVPPRTPAGGPSPGGFAAPVVPSWQEPPRMDTAPPPPATAHRPADGRVPCPDCGTGHDPDARFCPGCGRPFTHPDVPGSGRDRPAVGGRP